MAITPGICDVLKERLLKGEVDFDVNTFKIALYTSDATLSNSTTQYATTNEASGTGYTAGGLTLSGISITRQGANTYIDWSTDPSWAGSTFNANGALIYNDSLTSSNGVAILTWANATITNGTFTVQLPAPGGEGGPAAVIRLTD